MTEVGIMTVDIASMGGSIGYKTREGYGTVAKMATLPDGRVVFVSDGERRTGSVIVHWSDGADYSQVGHTDGADLVSVSSLPSSKEENKRIADMATKVWTSLLNRDLIGLVSRYV